MTESKGACIWFTGRSGAGKSTVTEVLTSLLRKHGRTVTILDVVPCLAKKWFEKTSEGKLFRKGFVAAEIVRHGGVAICVTVSARQKTRDAIRKLVGPANFVEVFVDVPADVCMVRKRVRGQRPSVVKRARYLFRGILARLAFRPRSSYEPPLSPEVLIKACDQTPEEGARAVFQYLLDWGFVVPKEPARHAPGDPVTNESQTARITTVHRETSQVP